MKWQHYVCHIEKMKNMDSKKSQSCVKNKIKSPNEEFISEVHWNFIYIYIIFNSFKWCDCCKFLSLKVHFTLKVLVFCMDSLINQMFKDTHRLAY